MPRRIYPNPPIVEAVIEFRFDGAPGDSERLIDALRSDYPGELRRKKLLRVRARLTGEDLTGHTEATEHLDLLPSADGRRLVGLGMGVLSVHVLSRYPGWECFVSAADQALSTYRAVAAPGALRAIGIRYIDQIALPLDPDLAIGDYFPGLPTPPPSMPRRLAAMYMRTETTDPAEGILSLLTLGSAPPKEDGRPVVLYDLNLIQTFPSPLPLDSWRRPLEALHDRQREIFEESITDRTRALFA